MRPPMPMPDPHQRVLLWGTADKLAAVHESDEFRDLIISADMAVGDMGIIAGFTGEGVAREVARFQRHIR